MPALCDPPFHSEPRGLQPSQGPYTPVTLHLWYFQRFLLCSLHFISFYILKSPPVVKKKKKHKIESKTKLSFTTPSSYHLQSFLVFLPRFLVFTLTSQRDSPTHFWTLVGIGPLVFHCPFFILHSFSFSFLGNYFSLTKNVSFLVFFFLEENEKHNTPPVSFGCCLIKVMWQRMIPKFRSFH